MQNPFTPQEYRGVRAVKGLFWIEVLSFAVSFLTILLLVLAANSDNSDVLSWMAVGVVFGALIAAVLSMFFIYRLRHLHNIFWPPLPSSCWGRH